jgi:predicted nucleic acid-binding protein
MIVYLDTSAYVKFYVAEPGFEQVAAVKNQAGAICTHLIAYAELRATLAKTVREGRLTHKELGRQLLRMEADWSSTQVVNATESMIRRAGDLAQNFALRGYDSVHLAAAEVVWQAMPGGDFRFLAFDDKLVEAARAMGMRVGF